jgi:hypothetical protein
MSTSRREQSRNTVFELMLRVWLTKQLRAFNKQSFHFVGNKISCRVEQAQFRPQLKGLVSKFTPAKDRIFQIDVGKECVNALIGSQEYKRSSASLAESISWPQS